MYEPGDVVLQLDSENVKDHPGQTEMWVFICPGCKCGHYFTLPKWTWNGDKKKPTVRASILIYTPETIDPVDGEVYPRETLCHLFVTDGKIQFLGDCKHALAGQTVEMKPYNLS